MSNELAVLGLNLPDYIKDLQLDDTTKALMGGGSTTKRISVRGSVWRMMVNGKEVVKNEDRAIQVVIVAGAPKTSRTFYANKWEEGEAPTAPDCWSANGDVPDSKAVSPQSTRCMDCPQNIKGSGEGESRACRYSQRLAVVLANDINGDVFQLTLPSKSIFGEGVAGKWPLQAYAKVIGGKGLPVTAVVTEMRFDTDSSTPKITFKPIRVLEAHEHQDVVRQGLSDAAKKAITMTVAEADMVKLSAPSKKAPQAEDAVVVSETAAEPVKKAKKSDITATADKADLSKLLSEWDD